MSLLLFCLSKFSSFSIVFFLFVISSLSGLTASQDSCHLLQRRYFSLMLVAPTPVEAPRHVAGHEKKQAKEAWLWSLAAQKSHRKIAVSTVAASGLATIPLPCLRGPSPQPTHHSQTPPPRGEATQSGQQLFSPSDVFMFCKRQNAGQARKLDPLKIVRN